MNRKYYFSGSHVMPSNDIQNYEKIEPPAPLEYTEVTEPVAQALRFEAKVFLRVLSALQNRMFGWLNFIFQGVVMSGGTPETMKISTLR